MEQKLLREELLVFRDARVIAIFVGTTQFMKVIIGSMVGF